MFSCLLNQGQQSFRSIPFSFNQAATVLQRNAQPQSFDPSSGRGLQRDDGAFQCGLFKLQVGGKAVAVFGEFGKASATVIQGHNVGRPHLKPAGKRQAPTAQQRTMTDDGDVHAAPSLAGPDGPEKSGCGRCLFLVFFRGRKLMHGDI